MLTEPSAAGVGGSSFARYFKTGLAFIFNLVSIGGAEAGMYPRLFRLTSRPPQSTNSRQSLRLKGRVSLPCSENGVKQLIVAVFAFLPFHLFGLLLYETKQIWMQSNLLTLKSINL